MDSIFNVYEKEFDINIMRADNYFETALSMYEATFDIYHDDDDMITEAVEDVKEKIKKTFAALIESIKAFINKCIEAINEKMNDHRMKKAFSEYNRYFKEVLKDRIKNGTVTKNSYKQIMSTIYGVEDCYISLFKLTDDACKRMLKTENLEEWDRINNKYADEGEFIYNSCANKKMLEEFMTYSSEDLATLGLVVDTTEVTKMNAIIKKLQDDADKHLRNLEEQALIAAAEAVAEEERKQAELQTVKGQIKHKAEYIKKLAVTAAGYVKKFGLLLSKCAIRLVSAIQAAVNKVSSKIKEKKTGSVDIAADTKKSRKK